MNDKWRDMLALKGKTLSLRKSVTIIILVGYCSLLILLMLLDYFLIENYQKKIREKEEIVLSNCIGRIEDEMDILKRILYDTYTYDKNFSALAGRLETAEKFSNAYDLRVSLESFMAVEEILHGFYLFYDKNEAPLYHINTDRIPSESASQIGLMLRPLADLTGESRLSSWNAMTIEDNFYLIASCFKGNVSLFGVINISGTVEEILGKETTAVLLNKGEIIKTWPESFKTTASDLLSNTDGEEYLTRNSYRIYITGVPNSQTEVCSVYKTRFASYLNAGQAILLVFTGLSVLLAAWILYVLRKNLVLPMRELCVEMDNVQQEKQTNTEIIGTCFSELRQMNETLHNTIEKLEEQKVVSYENYIDKQKAQMQFLQLQIQPHFYLNGLKVINGLVIQGDRERTQSFIISLSEHLRYLMQVDSEVTTLTKEVEFTKNYVYLRNRMSQRVIELTIDMDEKVAYCKVPTLLIQTFVDNSIKHARFGSSDIVLKIDVKIDRLFLENEQYLDIQVKDNGSGYDEDVLRMLNEEPKPGEKHIGISNLKRRCRIMYGDKAEFSFTNDDGAASECIIPLQEE